MLPPLGDLTIPGMASFAFGTTGNLGGWGSATPGPFGEFFVAPPPSDKPDPVVEDALEKIGP